MAAAETRSVEIHEKLVMNNATANVATNGNALVIKPLLLADFIGLKPLVILITSTNPFRFRPRHIYLIPLGLHG